MNTGAGLGPFMDNYIVILAGRYGAPIDCDSFSVENATAWGLVARAVQTALQHPLTDSERQQLKYVDPLNFTAEVCHHRAAYLLWKARRAAADAKGNQPSGFKVTQHSIADEIALIYQNARASLPSIALGDDEEDDDDVVEPLHIMPQKTAQEIARDQQLAEAEDELMRKVQELQVDFFGKHRKWVEVPLSITPTNSPQKSAAPSSKSGATLTPPPSQPQLQEVNFCIDNINRKLLVEVTPDELEVVFDALDISEHKSAFRRTNGRVLKTLQRVELQERFGRDREAADLLWAWIDERRSTYVGSGKKSDDSPSKSSNGSTVRPGTAEDSARQQVTAMLDMFRRMGTDGPAKPQPSKEYLDPLAQMKRAMNPHRPLRPSQQDYEEEEALAAAADDGDDPTTKPLPNRRAGLIDLRRGAPAAATEPPGPGAAAAAAAAGRANRWNIVEYEDDDDDDE
jgi:hypothetical protein